MFKFTVESTSGQSYPAPILTASFRNEMDAYHWAEAEFELRGGTVIVKDMDEIRATFE